MIDRAAVPGTSNTEDSPLTYWKARAENAEAALEHLSPASGGVSGEDGKLVDRLHRAVANHSGNEPSTSLLERTAVEAAERLFALLAERDRLERGYLDAAFGGDDAKAALSASNAALADALGLLREARRHVQADHSAGASWHYRVKALLANHPEPSP